MTNKIFITVALEIEKDSYPYDIVEECQMFFLHDDINDSEVIQLDLYHPLEDKLLN